MFENFTKGRSMWQRQAGETQTAGSGGFFFFCLSYCKADCVRPTHGRDGEGVAGAVSSWRRATLF